MKEIGSMKPTCRKNDREATAYYGRKGKKVTRGIIAQYIFSQNARCGTRILSINKRRNKKAGQLKNGERGKPCAQLTRV